MSRVYVITWNDILEGEGKRTWVTDAYSSKEVAEAFVETHNKRHNPNRDPFIGHDVVEVELYDE